MSCLQVTAFRPSLHIPDRYNTFHGLAVQRIAPVNIFNRHNSLKPSVGSLKKCTELMTCHVIQRTVGPRYQQCTPVCLFGGKGEPKNGNEASPWKSIEKAMSGLKKEKSLEDVLRQQMEKQDYFDDGSGEDPPLGGGGGGGGGGYGGTQDEGFAGMWDDLQQVTFAILALILVYVYIIMGDRVMAFITEGLEFLAGKRGPRLRTIMYEFAQFYDKFRHKVIVDPYWLEKAIISTPTWWDSPRKYQRMLRPRRRRMVSSRTLDSDDDDNDSDKDSDYENVYRMDSDNNNRYRKKAYSDDDNDNDNGAYSEDDDY